MSIGFKKKSHLTESRLLCTFIAFAYGRCDEITVHGKFFHKE